MSNLSISYNVSTLGLNLGNLYSLFEDLGNQKDPIDEVNIVLQNNNEDIYWRINENLSNYQYYFNIVQCKQIGLSLSRNIGLELASSDLVVLCDDDCRYPTNSSQLIKHAFLQEPNWEIITFCISNDKKLFRKYKKNSFRHNYKSIMHVSSIEIVIQKPCFPNIKLFDEKIGLGTPYITGAENIMLVDVLKMGKKIGFMPYAIVNHSCDTSAHNRSNINKLLLSKGVMFARMFGIFGFFHCIIFWVRRLIRSKNLKLRFHDFFYIVKGYKFYIFNKDGYFK